MEQAVGTELNDDVVNVVGGVLLWLWHGWAGGSQRDKPLPASGTDHDDGSGRRCGCRGGGSSGGSTDDGGSGGGGGGSSSSGLLLLLFALPFKEPLLVLLQCLVSSVGGTGVVWAKLEA